MITQDNLNLYFENKYGHGKGESLNRDYLVKIEQDGYTYEYKADSVAEAEQIAKAFESAVISEGGCGVDVEKHDEYTYTIETSY